MIILDTNAARIDLNGPDAELLRVIAKSGQQKVGVPWMVLEELVAQRVIEYRKAWQSAAKAFADLKRHRPWHSEAIDAIGEEKISDARIYWQRQYRAIFEVIPTSETALRTALSREAHRLKPAKDSERKGGARDAAIWLSAVEYAKSNPNEHIYFVTANQSDFGDGTSWPYPMNEDLAGMEDRITLLTGRSDVISAFTEPVANTSEEDVFQRLDSPHTRGYIAGYAVATSIMLAGTGFWLGSPFIPTGSVKDIGGSISPTPIPLRAWIDHDPHGLETYPWRVQDIAGHKIGDIVWYTATVQWLMAGWALAQTGAARAFATWRSRLLFSADDNTSVALIACDKSPTPLTGKDIAEIERTGRLSINFDAAFPDIHISAVDKTASYIETQERAAESDGFTVDQNARNRESFSYDRLIEPSFGPVASHMPMDALDALTVKSTINKMRPKQ